MKPILSSKVFPLTSEMGENTMEKMKNNTFSFLTHSTVRIVPLYVKKKISMCHKTIKQTKRSLFTSPNRGQTSPPTPNFYFIFRSPLTISTIYRKIKKILGFTISRPNLLNTRLCKMVQILTFHL